MKKRSWMMIAFLANLALLPLVLATPEKAAAAGSSAFFPCCKETSTGRDFCCSRCCVFTWNCMGHAHCETRLFRGAP